MKFTIFTGCYNSSKFIDRVFKSLKSQTYQNFEWIVIDDASSDNTLKILNDFKLKNKSLDIKLISLDKNRGVAKNRKHAIEVAKGDFFITWDHDDIQKANQLETFFNAWKNLGNDKIANIFSFCEDQNGVVLGEKFIQKQHVSNYFNHYKRHFMTNVVKQEKHVCTRVDVIKKNIKHIFDEGPIKDGEMLWAKIALDYNSIFINDSLRVYHIEKENLNNMSSRTRLQVAESVYFEKTIWVNYYIKALLKEPMLCIRLIFAKSFYGLLSNKSIKNIISSTKGFFSKFLVFFSLIPAKLLMIKMKVTKKGL